MYELLILLSKPSYINLAYSHHACYKPDNTQHKQGHLVQVGCVILQN